MPTLLRKAGLERRITDFFPGNKRTVTYFNKFFEEQGLQEIVSMQTTLKTETGIKRLMKYLAEHLHDQTPAKVLCFIVYVDEHDGFIVLLRLYSFARLSLKI